MLSIRMCVAVLAVIVTMSALGAVMCMKADGAVTVTRGDSGAMTVRFDPIGPVVTTSQTEGVMKFNVVTKLAVKVTTVDIYAIIVSVSAWFAVMVAMLASGV